MATRIRIFWLVVVALLAVAAFAPAAAAGGSGDEAVDIELFFTQLEPELDEFGNLISPPNGYFNMTGEGAICSGGLFYDEFINGEFETDDFQTYINIRDWKIFTCDNGETFTLEMYVEFLLDFEQPFDPFILVDSTWTVYGSSITGLAGYGTIAERLWAPLEVPRELWSGVFNVYDCKKGTWQFMTDEFGTLFKNQGDCVSYFATDGRNLAAG